MAGRMSVTLEKKGETGLFYTKRVGHTVVEKGPVWPNQDHEWPEDVYPDWPDDKLYITWETIYNVFDYQKIKILILE